MIENSSLDNKSILSSPPREAEEAMKTEATRLASTKVSSEEEQFEETLRPGSLGEFVGQERTREKLRICIEAAKQRGEALDHVLLSGPPGIGKTTLAHIIAKAMGSMIKVTSGPVLERKIDLVGILTDLKENDVFFIDEIHRLNNVVAECLYPAMEDYSIDLMLNTGPNAKTCVFPLQHFCLVGATTRPSLLTGPLRDRFGIICRLDFYSDEEILKIIMRSARILKVDIEAQAAKELAQRARRTPRVANRLLRRVRDYAQVKKQKQVTEETVSQTMEMLEVDELGLERIDREIIYTIAEKFSGGPVGLKTIAAALGEDQDNIEDVYEPYLIQLGFINRTPRGRVVTPRAQAHLNLEIKTNPQQEKLF